MNTQLVRLGDVLTLERIPLDVQEDETYTQIGIRSFGNGIFHKDPCLGSELSKLKYFKIHPGRLIVSNIMAWEGAIGLSTDREEGLVGSARFLSYRPAETVDARYLNYYFQSPAGRELARSASTGTVSRNQTLSPKNFERATIPLPELPEQRRIADKLDATLATVATTTTAAPQQESARLLAIGGLDRALTRWSQGTVRVDATCKQINDTVHPGDDPSPAKQFVGLEHIAPHFGQRIGARPLGDEKGRKFRFQPGDVLYGYLRPYLNKVWVADRDGLCSVEQYVLRPNGHMPAELIAAGLRAKATLDTVKEHTHNLQLPRLRSGLLMAIEIPDIPQEHHEAALVDVRTWEQKAHALNSLQRQRDDLLAALRPTLLNAAFSGQL
ncbi:restriction endonuclease subunit S [Streptomyces sp. NPDC059002]|uniref:restriction endonuclease subunit S n=1 Tax=Streptomyces sp. NPDC059002 TaxID=3346690 RepID=UPI0036CF520F